MSKINNLQGEKNTPMTNGCDMLLVNWDPEIQEASSNLDYNIEAGNQMYFWLSQT